MVWNDQLKREVPEGWEVKLLGEVASFSNGINYTSTNQSGKEYKIVNVRDCLLHFPFPNLAVQKGIG